MFLQPIDLTTALRPSLLPDEVLLFVQDAVGLYGGKYKLADYQHGQAYLTSHRACYVDNDDPRKKAVAVHLKDVDHHEAYAGFLKSSPKITLHPKANLRSNPLLFTGLNPYDQDQSNGSRLGSPLRSSFDTPTITIPSNATWICPICSFSNPVPSNFDPTLANTNTPLPPCLACGIKPPLLHVVKAALAAISNRHAGSAIPLSTTLSRATTPGPDLPTSPPPSQCPRCTFQNHPSLASCEICGAPLTSESTRRATLTANEVRRPESPGPVGNFQSFNLPPNESVKFSFRAGGDKVFLERLKGALTQRKWLLQSAPPPPIRSSLGGNDAQTPQRAIGIAGLERRGIELRKNNELVIGNAFEDLAALMASAKEIIALAETFASQTRSSTPNPDGTPSSPSSSTPDTQALLSQLNLTTTKDMLASSGGGSNSLYLTELSRSVAEFLTDDARGVLKSAHGTMSLVDLWSVFNRARGGVELVSPTDFRAAVDLFDKLKLPVRLRKFKSGLLVIQGRDRTDEKTTRELLAWLADLRAIPPDAEVSWDWSRWGRGITALETAERFGWSVGVAGEELEMAEERGALCREVGWEGVKFWENWLVKSDDGSAAI